LRSETSALNEEDDWSSISLCPYCGAGNPVNRVECIRCKKLLSSKNKLPYESAYESANKSKGITKEQIALFIEKALRGPVLCQLRIADVGDFLSELEWHFMTQGQGMSTGQALEHIDQNLVGVCPKCRTHTAGKGLAWLSVSQSDWSQGIRVFFTGDSGGAERLVVGKCRNQNCSCTLMLISWWPKGAPDSSDKPFLRFDM
jgi:hypothetical protein